MAENEHTCCAKKYVRIAPRWGETQVCGARAKVEHEGKWYCGVHSPEAQAKRDAKSKAAFDAKMAKWKEEHELPARVAALTAERDRLRTRCTKLEAALRTAERFIANGIALGYVYLSDADCPDPAHDTLPMLRALLAEGNNVPPP